MGWRRNGLGNAGLATLGLAPFLVGAVLQEKPKQGYAESLFSQAKPEHYIGDKACMECHPDSVTTFEQSQHAPYMRIAGLPLSHQGCEGCHGPGKLHLDEENPRVVRFLSLDPKEASLACLRCHKDTLTHPQWLRTAHAKADLSCMSCHKIHQTHLPGDKTQPQPLSGTSGTLVSPNFAARVNSSALLIAEEPELCGKCHKTESAEFRRISHHPIPEGRMICSDCHQLHPTSSANRKETPLKDKCVSCHPNSAGPFVFEHDPVAGWSGEGCMDCHRAHGSQNPRLLKSFSRGLCAQCHTDKMAAHYPGRTCWQAGCHVAPHGSNTDRLLRSP